MLVVSVRVKFLKIATLIVFIAVIISLVALTVMGVQVNSKKNTHLIVTNGDRVSYLNRCGWIVSDEAVEVSDVIIPNVFNQVYTDYNKLQQGQGFDLTEYKGIIAKKFTYEVMNYPDNRENVQANILVYNDRVIGGDISCIEIDGFTKGLRDKK